MKKYTDLMLVGLVGLLIMLGACSNDAWEDLPSKISSFVTQYFPNSAVKGYSATADGGHKVTISNGPTLIFNSDEEWIDIDGEGSKLPQVLMYDQLPPALYDYLQSTSQQADVYAVTRDKYFYKLTMLDTVITYTIATGDITYPKSDESAD